MPNYLNLATSGVTFATRERATAIATEVGSGDTLELSFDGVRVASPSFVDELIGRLAATHKQAVITGLTPSLVDIVDGVIERRRLKTRFKVMATIG